MRKSPLYSRLNPLPLRYYPADFDRFTAGAPNKAENIVLGSLPELVPVVLMKYAVSIAPYFNGGLANKTK